MRAGLLLLVATAAALFAACRGSGWVQETTDCPDPNEYFYQYYTKERYFDGELNQTSVMILWFGVECAAMGKYNQDAAIMYGLNVTNVQLNGTVVDRIKQDGDDVQGTQEDLKVALKGWFAFVMVIAGKDAGAIPATFHDINEEDEIVNIKKTLASTFQAKLNLTTSNLKVEVDPQSLHRSLYSHISLNSSHAHMVRTINDSDVAAFASSIPNEEIDYHRQETLDIRGNLVVRGEGTMQLKLLPGSTYAGRANSEIPFEELTLEDAMRAKLHRKRSVTYDEDTTFDPSIITNHYSAFGEYKVQQTGQRRVTHRHKRSTDQIYLASAVESSLLKSINHTRKAIKGMEGLRQKLGDITDALVQLHENPENTAIARKLESLVKKEAKFGPPPDYSPAVDEVLEYLNSLLGSPSVADRKMRLLLYYILSPEGSLRSQLALVQSLDQAVDANEEEDVLFYLAFVANPHPQMVARLEHLISSDVTIDEPLLLAYGAIVPRASPELQARMTTFLLDRLPMAELQKSSLIHHILALGNTGSPTTFDSILDYLGHPDQGVQLTSILALRSLLNETSVQNSLKDLLLDPDKTVAHVSMVAKAFLHGAEEASLSRQPRPYPTDLVQLLVAVAANTDDEEIHSTLTRYLRAVDTESSLNLLRFFDVVKSTNYQTTNVTRVRRGEQWDEDNAVYNLVAPLEERKADVLLYTHHFSYIWGKLFGGGDINMQIAAGGLAGVANDGEYKVFGHAVAQANLYNRHTTFLDFILLRKKSREETETKIYGNMMGKVLKNIDLHEEPEVCKTFNEPLYDGKVYTVFDFTYSVFVEVGTLDFEAKATVQFTAGLELAFCEGVGKLTAGAQLTPTLTLTVEASGDLEIVLVAKAGITADAVLNYQLQPGVSTELCYTEGTLRMKNCIGIYDQWKDSKIDLYVWYAWRGWCGWWFCTGDRAYQNKHKIDALSFTWNLPFSAKTTLIEKCDADYVCNEE